MKKNFLLGWIYLVATPFNLLAFDNCPPSYRPIIFVHGFLGSGDNWTRQIQRFKANGYCNQQLFVLDWNSLGSFQKSDSLLNRFVDSVLILTGQSQADLVGHSAGGMICYKYLKDSIHSKKIAHYAHIAGSRLGKRAGNNGQIPTLAISGKGDLIVKRYADYKVDIDLELDSLDHLALATDAASFRALYRFFNEGKEPATSTPLMPSSGNTLIGGRILMIGSNQPLPEDSLWVFQFDIESGKRLSALPYQRLQTDQKGRFPSFINSGNTGLEFVIRPKNGRGINYFLSAQEADNEQVYLRCLPNEGMVANLLKDVPQSKEESAIAIFSENHAMIAFRDTLSIDGHWLSTPSNMPAEKTAIACFLFDDGDRQSSFQPNPSFQSGAFITGIDCFIPAGADNTILLSLNGQKMRVPCLPSSENIIVAVFK
jgi:hypothetical protein